MASRGFNRSSGPSSIPRGEGGGGGGGGGGQTQFGNFPRFPSPSPPVSPFNNNNNYYYYNSPPQQQQQQQQQHSPPRLDTRPGFLFDSGGYEAPQRGGSHPLTLGRNPSNSVFSYPFEKSQRPTVSPPRWGNQTYQGPSSVEPYVDPPNAAVNIPARSANVQGPRRTRAPPIANNIYLDNFTQDVSVGAVPAVSPPRWGAHSKLAFGDSNSQAHQGPSSVPPYIASPSTTNIPARPANFQVSTRTKSPPYANEVSLDSYTQDVYGRGPGAPQGMQSPSQAFVGSHNVEDLHHPFGEASRWPTEPYNFQPPQKTRSPPLQSANEYIWRRSHPSQGSTDRAVVSSPSFGKPSTSSVNNSNSTIQQRSSFSPHNEAEGAGSKTMNSQVPKRNRSPSKASAEEHIPGTSYSTPDDTEREVQAKARRLARFGVELSQPVQRHIDHKQKSPANRHDQGFVERRKLIADQPTEATGEYMLSDYEGLEPSSVIIGLCPDMCPVSEREERERKGDLDKYERLDGDRNQTTISLAVKKYNRTAEREADLIRPMPVLQQTMEYLLVLLDQSYDDRFLGMYNFLWDRMRAIRMDLRMQHIFNQDAITMLEQMIRLHIIAMHELCEYTKGEGFSEGFDAHLNIEQMNKTSVELFQMYDDHRKKGSTVVSEKEFRGYYALLKLDKHPGYKVEPAELSLDLAKMTPETRQTPEILFARNVARACRTGNFIAFFRLARKATYLQACLMHAHFAKLRTQALVSLHSGLQNNQGIPIAQVTKWLGMEEEDIEGLLEYHGFLTKEFEEVYMVKEGPFLNADKDYPTKCSQLVHLKKSRRIIEDVSSSNQLMWPNEEPKQIELDKKVKTESKATQSVKGRPLLDAVDEVMLTLEEEPALIDDPPVELVLETPLFGQTVRSVHEVAAVWGVPSPQQSPQSAAAAEKVVKVGKPTRETLRCDSLERNLHYNVQSVPPNSVLERPQPSERSEGSFSESSAEKSDPLLVIRAQEDDETLIVHQQSEDEEAMIHHYELESEEDMVLVHQDDEEVAMAKLKLILRKWKRLSSKRKELREQRQLAASVALSSLTLGPPINQMKAPSSHVYELDIDRAVRERRERQQRSWSRMNISEVVGGILSERNPDAKCLCWKLIVCSQPNVTEGDNFAQRHQTSHSFSRWMQSKLMGVRKDNDDELVFLAPDLSIWKKWVTDQYDSSPICCLSVVREVKFNALEDNVGGAGAILFLVSESTPLDVQKTQLHNLSMSLPSGSSVPLLIISGTQKEGSLNPLMIINGLGLHDVDKTRISSFSVCSLAEDQPPEHLDGIFSTVRLREGLQWLASQSPIQPVVHCIKTRELVMDHLSSLLGVLENMDFSVVEPNHCISAFNESLDRSTTEVANAAESNSSGWPCLEITLLESGIEHSVVKSFLPSVGWSSAAIVEPILGRIKGCKLPFFPDGLSWLNNGSDMGEEILHHKSELEKCLISYLTHSSNMMDKELATTEACLVLQKGALLELHGSSYRIRPKWAHIFRRIFNWRLMNLSSGEDSAAYVFEHRNNDVAPSVFGDEEFSTGLHSPDDKGLDLYRSLPCSLTLPSLDDMVGVCYNTCQFGREQLKSEANQPLSRTLNLEKEAQHAAIATYEMENEGNPQQEVETTETDDAYLSGNLSKSLLSDDYISKEVVRATNKGKKESDKLSKLLEQCNILQNKIDEKLSIYF